MNFWKKIFALYSLACVCGLTATVAQPMDAAEIGYSPARLLNQGNDYFRQGQYAAARVSYERALLLKPRFKAAAHNLTSTLEKLNQENFTPTWWRRPLWWLNANEWAVVISAMLVLLAAVWLHRCWRGDLPNLLKRLAIAATGCAVVAGWGIAEQLPQFRRGIVLESNAPLRISPFAQAQALKTLPAGSIATVRELYGDYYRIEDRSGQNGWIAMNQFEPLVPELVETGRFSSK